MEVTIDQIQGIENDSIISIRAGSTRRQAPINAKQAFSFPSLPLNANPFKIDVLRPVCSQRVKLKDSSALAEEVYDVLFPSTDGAAMSMRVKVKESPQMCGGQNARGGGDAAFAQEVDGVPAVDMDLNQRKAERTAEVRSAAESYLERFKLLKFVQEMLQYIIREKPEDPYSWMSDYLQKFDGGAGKASQGQAIRKSEDAAGFRKDAKSQLLGASLDGRLESVFKKLNPPKEKPAPSQAAASKSKVEVLAPKCSCGNIFMDDSLFCRKCGSKRLRIKPFSMKASVGTWISARPFPLPTPEPEPAAPDFRCTPQSFFQSQYSSFSPAPGSPKYIEAIRALTSNPDFRLVPNEYLARLHSQFNSPQVTRGEPASLPPAEADKAGEPGFQSRELPFDLAAAAPEAAPQDQVMVWMSRQNNRLDEENERIRKEILQLYKYIQDQGVTLSPAAQESLAALRSTGILDGVIQAEHEELAGKNRQLRSEHEALRNTLAEFCLGLSSLAKGLADSVATTPVRGANAQQAPLTEPSTAQLAEDAAIAENARLEAENQALMRQIQELQT